ncbi:MAG TPA: hypothetical protein VLJ12_05305 [Burkholderiales bacterium]|nr:hypothetical protein [Burkholderiales bacterium]
MEQVIHPFVAGASVAVILLSGVGIAAVTGYLPGSSAQRVEHQMQIAVVLEVKARGHQRYDVSVRLPDGSVKTLSADAPPAWKSGDKVRVVDGRLEPV